MDRRTLGIVIAISGIIAAGAGAAIAASSRKRVLGGLRGAGLGRADMNRMLRGQVTRDDKTTKVYRGDKISIEERVGILQELTARAVKDPEMAKLARAITGSGGQVTFGTRRIVVRGANCRPRDSKCEARAIYDWKRKNLRYTGDIAPHVLSLADTGGKKIIEAVDLFKTPMKTIEDGGGDCDEQAPVGAALAILNGIPAKFVVSSMEKRPGDDEWSHIWDEVFLGAPKNGPSKWAAIDSTLEGDYFGISAPAAARKEFPA